MNYEIYTDGSCSPHSGKAGCWAYVVVVDDEVITEDYGIHSSTTNSKMELLALKEALKVAISLVKPGVEVVIKSDSQYCVKSYNEWSHNWEANNWRKSNKKPVEHVEDWKEMHLLRHPQVKVEWVKGHAGNKWNEYCDRLTHNR